MTDWTEQKKLQKLTKQQIKEITDKAYADMVGLIITDNLAPQVAIAAVMATWNQDYYKVLAKAFSKTLERAVGEAEIRDYRVGTVKLSDKLHKQAGEVAREVQAIVTKHAQGWHDVKRLSLDLYDGYTPDPQVLKIAKNNPAVSKAIRDVVLSDHKSKAAIAKLMKRYADGLKTPALKAAYMEALDAAEKGAGADRLQKKLDVAFNEKMRYNANRIAQTEMHKVWQQAEVDKMLADPSITAVRFVMSANHAVADICDVYARQDKYGLGKGMYPLGKAPVPPLHPFCRCRLAVKRTIDGSKGVEATDSERKFLGRLAKKNPQLAARVAGSQTKLQATLNGQDFTGVQNASRDPVHAIKQVSPQPQS